MSYPPVLILIIEEGEGGRGEGMSDFFVLWSDFLMKSSTSYRNVHSDNAEMKTRVWWVSFAPELQCCYFCEPSCLFYLSFNFDFYVSKIMHL